MFSLWVSSTVYKLKQQNCWYNLFKKKLNMFRVVKMFFFFCASVYGAYMSVNTLVLWCICVGHMTTFSPWHCLQWTDDRCLELIFSLHLALKQDLSCFSVCFRLAGQQPWGDSPLCTSHLPIVILGLQMGSTTFGFFMCILEIFGSSDLPNT